VFTPINNLISIEHKIQMPDSSRILIRNLLFALRCFCFVELPLFHSNAVTDFEQISVLYLFLIFRFLFYWHYAAFSKNEACVDGRDGYTRR
jgi:hypothetical protein